MKTELATESRIARIVSQVINSPDSNAEVAQEVKQLREAVSILINQLSPYIGQDEMQTRYGVTGQTLLAMERRKEIPTRIRGRWRRDEVLNWESE